MNEVWKVICIDVNALYFTVGSVQGLNSIRVRLYYRKSAKDAISSLMSSTWSTLLLLTISATSLYAARSSYIAIANLRKYEERSERAAKYSETAAQQLYKTRVTQSSSAAAVRRLNHTKSSVYYIRPDVGHRRM